MADKRKKKSQQRCGDCLFPALPTVLERVMRAHFQKERFDTDVTQRSQPSHDHRENIELLHNLRLFFRYRVVH